MELYIEKNYESMSQLAASFLLKTLLNTRRVNVAITAGNTPKRLYEIIIPLVKNKAYFSHVHYYNFDEIPVYDEQGTGLTMKQLNQLFFHPAEIPSSQIEVMTTENYLEFDKKVANEGGLDLIVMGIGADGHFCGNLPNTSDWHDQTLKIEATEAHKAIFLKEMNGEVSQVPDHWVTMGPKSVMQARTLILFANGQAKAGIIKKALEGPITREVPASILQLHPNLIVILDEEAASELSLS